MVRNSSRRHRYRHRRGATIVLVAIVTPVLLGFTALAVDVGLIYCMDAETQGAVDAAALAGASGLTDVRAASLARQRAAEYLGPNLLSRTGSANTSNIEVGTWDETARAFLPNGAVTNAVRVTATRHDAPLFFGAVLGWNKYDMTRSAVAMLSARDIALVIDLSGSMNDDSELRHFRDFVSDSGTGTRPAVQVNLKNIWQALPASKSRNGVANGSNPGTPVAASGGNDQPGNGPGQPRSALGNPSAGAEPIAGTGMAAGPRWGWMTGWGTELTRGAYDATSDGGLYWIPSGSTCRDADVIANLTESGYSPAERAALLSGSGDGSTQQYYNRLKVCLGPAGWRSGKGGGKYTSGGDGNDTVDSGELTSLVPWPFLAGTWDQYAAYVASSRTRMVNTDGDFRYRFGIKTFVNYLLENVSAHNQAPELAAVPELPVQSVKDAVQAMATILAGLGGNDQLSLEVFATTGRHEADLTSDFQFVADRLKGMQSNHYDSTTNIGGGLDKAIAELLSVRARPQARKIIVLMTDGKPNVDRMNTHVGDNSPAAVNWAYDRARLAADNGIVIYTVAVGGDADRNITRTIASAAGGEEFFAGATPEEYTPELQRIFERLGGKQVVQLVK